MSSKYLWCKGLPSSYKDTDGNRLCVFHAPVRKKRVASLSVFNRLVFERILEENSHGRSCDLSGTVFEGVIDLQKFFLKNPSSEVSFANATFTEALDLSGVEFLREVDFRKAIFCGDVDFKSASFCSETNFEGAVFQRGANFSNAEFKAAAHFFDSTFHELAFFNSVKFGAEIYFSLGSFKKGANFTNSKYGSTAVFKRPLAGLPQEQPPEPPPEPKGTG